MAAEGDVKTKTGLMKSMARALQNRAFYDDTSQFDTKEFQEIVQLLRELNSMEQQLLLSGQHILMRGKMTGISLDQLQEYIPEIREWLSGISVKESTVRRAPKVAKEADEGDAPTKRAKPTPAESAANAGSFFTPAPGTPTASLDVQVSDDAQRLAPPAPPAIPPPAGTTRDQITHYYKMHTHVDGEQVAYRFRGADKRLSDLDGVHIITDEDLASWARTFKQDLGGLEYSSDSDVLRRYREALAEELGQAPPPEPAITVDSLDAFAGEGAQEGVQAAPAGDLDGEGGEDGEDGEGEQEEPETPQEAAPPASKVTSIAGRKKAEKKPTKPGGKGGPAIVEVH